MAEKKTRLTCACSRNTNQRLSNGRFAGTFTIRNDVRRFAPRRGERRRRRVVVVALPRRRPGRDFTGSRIFVVVLLRSQRPPLDPPIVQYTHTREIPFDNIKTTRGKTNNTYFRINTCLYRKRIIRIYIFVYVSRRTRAHLSHRS